MPDLEGGEPHAATASTTARRCDGMRELRVAIVGAGDVARRDYLPEFHRLAGRARLELVCGRSAGSRQGSPASSAPAGWSTDWSDALGDDIDVVVNLTPAPTHGEINLAAVQAGKHLYSEKPVARDRVEGARIADAAAASGSYRRRRPVGDGVPAGPSSVGPARRRD